ncbi:DUF6924 domain-containing protein [Streptomyces sp. NPDC001274]
MVIDACQRQGRGGSPAAGLDEASFTDEERCRIPGELGTSHAVFIRATELSAAVPRTLSGSSPPKANCLPAATEPSRPWRVDAPAWSGATADEVLAAVVDEDLSVVFLADRETMQSPTRALLALSTVWEDSSGLDPLYYQELIESPEPREFRAVPAAVHGVQVALALGNVGFAECAGADSEEPDQVLRPI